MSMAQVMMITFNYVYLYFLLTETGPNNTLVLVNPYGGDIVLLIMAGTAFLAFFFSFFVKEELRRLSSVLDISISSIPTTPKVQYR